MGRFITLTENNRVLFIRTGGKILPNEIETELGKVGQVLNENGDFIDYIPTQEEIEEEHKSKRLAHLKEELDEAIRFNNTEEIARCQQAYLDINNGVGCVTKAEIEASIPYKIQDSIDAYNLELIEMGVL